MNLLQQNREISKRFVNGLTGVQATVKLAIGITDDGKVKVCTDIPTKEVKSMLLSIAEKL